MGSKCALFKNTSQTIVVERMLDMKESKIKSHHENNAHAFER